ncbi:hypothetical protein D3C73_782780 [compost metagenome]
MDQSFGQLLGHHMKIVVIATLRRYELRADPKRMPARQDWIFARTNQNPELFQTLHHLRRIEMIRERQKNLMGKLLAF